MKYPYTTFQDELRAGRRVFFSRDVVQDKGVEGMLLGGRGDTLSLPF